MAITPAQFREAKTGDLFEDSNGIKWKIFATKAWRLLKNCPPEVFAHNPKKKAQLVRLFKNKIVDENNNEITELNHPKAELISN